MIFEEVGFRPFKNKLVVLPNRGLMNHSEIQSVLCYGVIHEKDGFGFGVLATSKDNDSFEAVDQESFFLASSLKGLELEVLDNEDLMWHFEKAILGYRKQEGSMSLIWTRELHYLDEFRTLYHPDRIEITLDNQVKPFHIRSMKGKDLVVLDDMNHSYTLASELVDHQRTWSIK